ncbi:hypothetical protein [Clostridium pasteurianum]|uniref:Uncharacterized protein n=1 Tax=Clostridium pasteurianum BC1 TaxID=86416 RepID=R4K8D9_CLOPA|nr:hypothetical protein [Clostridium pasteurianum]AGK98823.1 hypothetical protein Clopa_4083 [Clostridium pasteurianum BC1]
MRIWGKVIKNNKIIKDEVVISDGEGSYQDNLKLCIKELCYKLDISKPYWLPPNVKEYNRRRKTTFNENHFIDEIDFDKFIIEEISSEEN